MKSEENAISKENVFTYDNGLTACRHEYHFFTAVGEVSSNATE
jgi:hypothetical protein